MISAIYTLTGYVRDPSTGEAVQIKYMEAVYRYTSDLEGVPGVSIQKTRKTIETRYQFKKDVKDFQLLDEKGTLIGRIREIEEIPFNLLQRKRRDKVYRLILE